MITTTTLPEFYATLCECGERRDQHSPEAHMNYGGCAATGCHRFQVNLPEWIATEGPQEIRDL